MQGAPEPSWPGITLALLSMSCMKTLLQLVQQYPFDEHFDLSTQTIATSLQR